MARRKGFVIEVAEDTRPYGSVLFADPSKAEFPRHIHTFNEPHDSHATGSQSGVRSITGKLVQWADRHAETDGDGAWAAMNRKRGVHDEEK